MEELLPCPFCGGEAEQVSELDTDSCGYWAICQSCGAKAATYYNSLHPTTAKEMSAAAWNRRSSSCAISELAESCEGCRFCEEANNGKEQ